MEHTKLWFGSTMELCGVMIRGVKPLAHKRT